MTAEFDRLCSKGTPRRAIALLLFQVQRHGTFCSDGGSEMQKAVRLTQTAIHLFLQTLLVAYTMVGCSTAQKYILFFKKNNFPRQFARYLLPEDLCEPPRELPLDLPRELPPPLVPNEFCELLREFFSDLLRSEGVLLKELLRDSLFDSPADSLRAEPSFDESLRDELPRDEPPRDELPLDEPPLDEPPLDELPLDDPPLDDPPDVSRELLRPEPESSVGPPQDSSQMRA